MKWAHVTGGTIKLADGQQLQFDWLVLALGSSTSTFGIPGVKEYAYAFNDFNDAMRVSLCCGLALCRENATDSRV